MRPTFIIYLIFLIPLKAFAGDCYSHPMFIHKMDIQSCEVISEMNAGGISSGASPKVVASRYPGVIVTGYQRAIRKIDLEEHDIKFQVHPWEKTQTDLKVLYQGKIPNDCSGLSVGTTALFASYTNCECDTGPAPDGYCALNVRQVNTVPRKYLKYVD